VGPGSPKDSDFPFEVYVAIYPLQLLVPLTSLVVVLNVICGFLAGYKPPNAIRGPEIYSSSQVVSDRLSVVFNAVQAPKRSVRIETNNNGVFFIIERING
jgi:hypothetical protein